MARRIEPWEIPAHERATVGRVLEGLAAHFHQQAHFGFEPEGAEEFGRRLSLSTAADDIREYAAEILSWSHVHASQNSS